MDDAELDLGQGPGGPDGIRQTLETVAAHDERVPDAPVAELGQKLIQNLAPSPPAGPTHKPSTSRSPSRLMPMAT